jgi:dTDP-4-amino-4,6-dideoxygalactose transaminase
MRNIKKTIRLSKSCLSNLEKSAVMKVLDKEYLGMGEEVQEFERQLTKFFGRPTVCVSSGTAALHLALQAVGIKSGDEVLVQSLTYVASFQAISATSATPIACDVDPNTLCIDLKDAENKVTKNTKAIMPVHYSGGVGELNQVYSFADKHGLRVIEDAAHAFGTQYLGVRVGGIGDVTCFSFDGIKNITSGEGGCIVSDDKGLLDKIRDARLLGVEKDTDNRYLGKRSWNFDVSSQGWRYHMSDIMAAIGIQQLKRFNVFADRRQSLARKYDKLLSNSPNIKLLNNNYYEVVPHIYIVQLNESLNRDNIIQLLNNEGIQAGIHYLPNHLLSYYAYNAGIKNTESIYQGLISLPLHYDLSENDVEYVCNKILDII